MPQTKGNRAPIRQSVHVDCQVEDAFRLFTESFGEWWPLAEHCEMEPWEGGRLFERSGSGEELDWGTVTGWNPPDRLTLAWNPEGRDGGTVDVEFQVEADGTRVTLIHTNWDRAGAAACFANFIHQQMFTAV
jgi:hypothetical protein